MPFESVRIDLPILAFVAAARVAAPVAPPDAGDADAELDGLDELEVLELDELEDVFESLLQAAATSRTALMRRSEARFIPVRTGGGRYGIAGMARKCSGGGSRTARRRRHQSEADQRDAAPLSPRTGGPGHGPSPEAAADGARDQGIQGVAAQPERDEHQ